MTQSINCLNTGIKNRFSEQRKNKTIVKDCLTVTAFTSCPLQLERHALLDTSPK